MTNTTIFIIRIVFLTSIFFTVSCNNTKEIGPNSSVEEIREAMEQEDAAKEKASRKARRKAEKRFWSMQSKEVKKRIRKSNRRRKREARKKRSWF